MTEHHVAQEPVVRSRSSGWSTLRSAYTSGEAVWALLLVLIGLIGLRTALGMDIRAAHDPLGGRFFPVMTSTLMMVAAGAVLAGPLLRALVGQRSELGTNPGAAADVLADIDPDQQPDGLFARPLFRVAFMAAVAIVYVALMDFVGYIPATIVGMAGVLYLLGIRRIRTLVVGPLATSVIVYLIFTQLLLVRLP